MSCGSKKTILLYGIAGWEPEKEARAILLAIRKLGWRSVFVCDRQNPACDLADRTVLNPLWRYDLLKQTAEVERCDYAFLLTDFATPLVGKLNRELSLPGPNDHQYAQANDKLNWATLARSEGLDTLREKVPLSWADLQDPLWDFPLIVKPSKSTGAVSNRPYGYRFFANLSAFRHYLEKENLVDEFLTSNQRGGYFGKFFLQEQVNHETWGHQGITIIDGKVTFNELHHRYLEPYPWQTLQYASIGPMPLTLPQRLHAEKVTRILTEKIGFNQTGISFDIIESRSGKIYTGDVNTRFGSTFTTFMPMRGYDYLCEALKGFVGQSHTLAPSPVAYLRHKIPTEPGKILEAKWPENLPENIRIEGKDAFKPGLIVPEKTGRLNWSAEALIVGESTSACLQLYKNEVLQKTKITYERPHSPQTTITSPA